MAGFSLNSVTISGNLTREPELRNTNSGTSVVSLRIANNNRRKQGDSWVDEPMYFDVTVWSGLGEWVANNVKKGDGIAIVGRLMWREFTDKDNNKRQAVSITADSLLPVPKASSALDTSAPNQQGNPANAPADDPPPF